MSQRNEHIHSLTQDFIPLVLRHELNGPAVVQTVRKLDEHDSDIIIEGQQNALEILCLETLGLYVGHLGAVFIVEHGLDLRQAVHQGCHLVSEQGADIIHGIFRILHHVVEQGSSHGFVSETDFLYHYLCNLNGMENIRLT